MNIINILAKKIGRNAYLKNILQAPYNYLILKPRKKKQNSLFLKNGITVLTSFDTALRSIDTIYSLTFGSLLGAIREKGFIKHDLDIDVAVECTADRSKIRAALLKEGFIITRQIEVDGGDYACEETYSKCGVGVDIFYYYPYDENRSMCAVFQAFDKDISMQSSIEKRGGMKVKLVKQPLFNRDIIYADFETIKMPIFKNAQEFVETIYGDGWRVPEPNRVPNNTNLVLYDFPKDKIGIVKTIF